ncbi:alkaline phosphatase-like [Daktulosphaira vitifoliae]|uniref:alkaline phosphatase-like n=1 Tax=Daktulosphaira vitifoliae TaxID=58002 RepID=UPI0021AA12E2|nr:alkaline phosphatase-like [Daktulosphaira vitifoliae]
MRWRLLVAAYMLPLIFEVGWSITYVEDEQYWKAYGISELKNSLRFGGRSQTSEKHAKNLVIFIGDGMGPNTVTAARIYNNGESGRLTFEKFPHIGLLKTYSVNKQVPDAASATTAMFTGVKVNQRVIGLDAYHNLNDTAYCNEPMKIGLETLATWAQQAGKHTGFVTNSRITDATPAALYAQVSNRKWECDTAIPANTRQCKDIARQLIEDEPGRNFKVIMGGGRQSFVANPEDTLKYVDKKVCVRSDGRNLVDDWIRDKNSKNSSYRYVTNLKDMISTNVETTDYVLGLFSEGWMPMDLKNQKTLPTLEKMTDMALQVLSKSESGFFLMVEGGSIDLAHHKSMAKQAIEETFELDKAINQTLHLLKLWNILNDTLVVVTSDHASTLSINGYPKRGKSILGVAGTSLVDDVKYTTLTYSIGYAPKAIYTRLGKEVIRQDPTIYDTSGTFYNQVGIMEETGVHGGNDVVIYAQGPMGYLFHSIHEQSYVAHAVAYATKIGPYQNGLNNSTPPIFNISYLLLTTIMISFVCK